MFEIAGQRRRKGGEMLFQVSALPDRPRRGRAGIDDRKARMSTTHVTDENAVVAAQFPGLRGVQLRGAKRRIIATMPDLGQLNGAEFGSKSG